MFHAKIANCQKIRHYCVKFFDTLLLSTLLAEFEADGSNGFCEFFEGGGAYDGSLLGGEVNGGIGNAGGGAQCLLSSSATVVAAHAVNEINGWLRYSRFVVAMAAATVLIIVNITLTSAVVMMIVVMAAAVAVVMMIVVMTAAVAVVWLAESELWEHEGIDEHEEEYCCAEP